MSNGHLRRSAAVRGREPAVAERPDFAEPRRSDGSLGLFAQDVETIVIEDAPVLLHAARRLTDQTVLGPQRLPDGVQPLEIDRPRNRGNIDYGGLLADSFGFLTLQHSCRIASEYRTRQALKGPFWEDYAHALTVWRGLDDGDTLRVNYLGHPAMGSTSAFIFANNDAVSQATSYGQPGYGRAKWRQFLFANVYSLQFELGPYSEASVGNVDQALIDHILTPTAGTAWSVVEDVIDAKLIVKLHAVTRTGPRSSRHSRRPPIRSRTWWASRRRGTARIDGWTDAGSASSGSGCFGGLA